jgi:prevent-host-death family protein
MDTWKLQDAKARFSEVVERALKKGPQLVTRHGEKAVVVVAYEDFAGGEPTEDFTQFLLSIPRVELDLSRRRHLPRKTRL